ncbi:MAG: hypothetical protein Tsb0013_00500 [Phycisphaerales bacterium]
MTRKERIKTYLTGVLIGVLLLVVWSSIRAKTQGGAPASGPGAAGVPSPPADATEATDSPGERDDSGTDEGPRRTP